VELACNFIQGTSSWLLVGQVAAILVIRGEPHKKVKRAGAWSGSGVSEEDGVRQD
jgi:hypothetical protein